MHNLLYNYSTDEIDNLKENSFETVLNISTSQNEYKKKNTKKDPTANLFNKAATI